MGVYSVTYPPHPPRTSTYRIKANEPEVIGLRGADRSMFKVKLVVGDGDGGLDDVHGVVWGSFMLVKGNVPIMYGMKCFNKKRAMEDKEVGGLEKERQILGEFESQSPFVPILLGSFQTSTSCFSVFQHPISLDLGSVMGDSTVKIKSDDAKFYISCIVLALKFLEKEGYMVRMVNPSSVMLSHKGYPILSTLTHCKKLTGQKSFTICGEQAYMAPEMISGSGYDFAVDAWGLGVLCYEMILGGNPFDSGETGETEVYKNIAMWEDGGFGRKAKGEGVSGECIECVDGLLGKEPGKRLGSLGAQDIKVRGRAGAK